MRSLKSSLPVLISSLLLYTSVFADDSEALVESSALPLIIGSYIGLSIEESSNFSGTYLVESVEHSADFIVLVLKNIKDGSIATVKFSAKLSGKTSIAVGDSIEVNAKTSGYFLTKAGQIIAFIPNKVGQTLMYHGEHQTNNVANSSDNQN